MLKNKGISLMGTSTKTDWRKEIEFIWDTRYHMEDPNSKAAKTVMEVIGKINSGEIQVGDTLADGTILVREWVLQALILGKSINSIQGH